jgi:purine-binding chemotaxis protein CheW
LPQAPPTVDGILNVRGETIVLLNLRKRFGLADKPLSVSDHFIIAWAGARAVALRVDRVLNLMRLPIRSLADAERFLTQPELVCGVAVTEDGMVMVHELESFLSITDHELLAQALANQSRARHK